MAQRALIDRTVDQDPTSRVGFTRDRGGMKGRGDKQMINEGHLTFITVTMERGRGK